MALTNGQVSRTCAKRKLLSEANLLQIKQRVDLGVPLNTAVRMLAPNISNVAAIKLYNWYNTLNKALQDEDFELYDSMHKSMFPNWDDQPDGACYIGQFPFGHWEVNQ